jgi:hypothetical protein
VDKQLIKEKIAMAFQNFTSAIGAHTDINKKRADGGWSVGEIGAHIIKSTRVQFGNTKKTDRPYDLHANSIRDLFLNFNMKFPAMPELQPEAKQYSTGELFAALDRNKDAVFTMIDKDDITETCIDIELPVWGALTKYEWLVLMENHIIRHTRQVNEFDKVA